MKRMFLTALLCSFFCASNVYALPTYQMDAATAAGMRKLAITGDGDIGTLGYVGYNPGALSDRVYGVLPNYGGSMFYDIGFSGGLYAAEVGETGTATMTIGLYNGGASLGLSSETYDGFLLSLSNDNDDIWSYQAYVIYNLGAGEVTVYSGAFLDLDPGTQTSLLVSTPGLDYSNVVGIGFTIQWLNINNPDGVGGYRSGDQYHTSVVPVPGALLLGLIGLGSLRLKFRKSA